MTDESKAAPKHPTEPEEPVLTDEEFATADIDNDGVVHVNMANAVHDSLPKGSDPTPTTRHLLAEQMAEARDNPDKARKAAPENKDAAALRDDKADDGPPEPIGENLRPGRRGRR